MAAVHVSVQRDDFAIGEEYQSLRASAPGAGAIVTFSGLVRDLYDPVGGEKVSELQLEHYPGMTEKCIREIIGKAQSRWQPLAVRVLHRIGALAPGEQIVFVGVAGHHRGESFAAASFIMDYLKSEAPFWKKQLTPAGSEWISPRQSDYEAKRRA